jgi:hypothetical protein
MNRTLVLNCPAVGSPTPDITWYKEGLLLDVANSPRVEFLSSGRQLRIPYAQLTDTGTFVCEATNKAGADHQDYDVQIQSTSSSSIVNHVNSNKPDILTCKILLIS